MNEPSGNKSSNVNEYSAFGVTGNLADLSRTFGMKYTTLVERVKRGMTPEEALSRPCKTRVRRKNGSYEVNGFKGSLVEVSKNFNIPLSTLESRIKGGRTLEEAVNFVDKRSRIYSVKGFTGSITEIAEHFCIKRATLVSRLKRGVPIRQAVNNPSKLQ